MVISLLSAQEIRIVSTEEAPTNYTSNGKFIGTSVDIVNKLKEELNETSDIEVYPWARSYKILKSNPNVMAFTAGKTKEREEMGLHFVGPLFTRKYVLFKKKGSSIEINNIDDIKKQNLVLGCMRDDWRSTFFKSKGIAVDEVTDHKVNIKKLLNGRIDLWILSDLEVGPTIREAGFSMSDIEPAFVFKEGQSYMIFSRDTKPEIVKKWQNAFQNLESTDFFSQLATKWSKKLELNLGYKSGSGLIIK
jgi:ABC-type amino acid transport substrate-binding protein